MTTILFVGGGNMGFALAMGLNAQHPDIRVAVADPLPEVRDHYRDTTIATVANAADVVHEATVIVLAVKPQVIDTVLSSLQSHIQEQLVISIAAGTTLLSIEQRLKPNTPIVRCMPNTPALVGAGISGLVANDHVTVTQKQLANTILSATGATHWFSNDAELDAVTALSGSGPAYFFYVIEALIDAGVQLGLRHDVAKDLVVQTAVGAAKMVVDSIDGPAQLRANVTSPGGTTERALAILEERETARAFKDAAVGAFHRAKELSK